VFDLITLLLTLCMNSLNASSNVSVDSAAFTIDFNGAGESLNLER
jgi:hypothetical protein